MAKKKKRPLATGPLFSYVFVSNGKIVRAAQLSLRSHLSVIGRDRRSTFTLFRVGVNRWLKQTKTGRAVFLKNQRLFGLHDLQTLSSDECDNLDKFLLKRGISFWAIGHELYDEKPVLGYHLEFMFLDED